MIISKYFLKWKHIGFSIHSFKMAIWDQSIKCSGMVKKSFPCWLRPYLPRQHRWQLRVHTEPKEVRSVHMLSWGTSSGLIQLYLQLSSHTTKPTRLYLWPLPTNPQPTCQYYAPCLKGWLAVRIKRVPFLWRTKDREWHIATAPHVNSHTAEDQQR